jgi:predicted ATP-dependent protease
LLRESDYWAGVDGVEVIGPQHVRKAIDQQIYRTDRVRELVYEEIRRGNFLVDVEGLRVGQVNGLSVMSLGNTMFGRPIRITATARMGSGKVVDIEREVELGGPTHSKGVMILSSLLSSRYALDCPLCLSASLVFEQSYGMVDGDSASMAELCALLSTLANIPIRQGFAITGSVNQHGQAQGIGGATEKIEGFYDVCSSIGLTGDQAVLIPASNVKHLMLRPDVLEAVDQGKFAVHTYNNVDEAVQLLTGMEAGERNTDGSYPPDTVNFLVDKRLHELADTQRNFSKDSKDSDDE